MAQSLSILHTETTPQGFSIVLSVGSYLVSVSYKIEITESDMLHPQGYVEIVSPPPDMIFQEVFLSLPRLTPTPNKLSHFN